MPESAPRGLLVGQSRARPSPDCRQFAELHELARAAGVVVAGELRAVRQAAVSATFLGRGKLAELAALACEQAAAVLVFNHDLSPLQERNISDATGCEVLGRSALILSIFARRARTREGALQVEMAQLSYLSTRLVRGWTHLERQKGGIGLRGPGETQLEIDRRLLHRRLKMLKRQLGSIDRAAERHRCARRRARTTQVALVGYTNAGKTTLFNRLSGAGAVASHQLFATLDPLMRRIDLPGFGPIVLSDTVGFIRELPHSLIAAFRATLAEVAAADCLLLVEDAADPARPELHEHVLEVLSEIGAADVPRLIVHNKIDLLEPESGLESRSGFESGAELKSDSAPAPYPNSPPSFRISAAEGTGLDELRAGLGEFLAREQPVVELKLAPEAGELRARLYEASAILADRGAPDGGRCCAVRMPRDQLHGLLAEPRFAGLWEYP